jgi:ABC-type polysaccharide/polyol phosphate transport system ATPase subunit
MSHPGKGSIELRGVTRSYRLLVERNLTLKETLVRRRRVRARTLMALNDVDLEVAPGTSLGVIGPNGAGKSTLLKLIAGILPPNSGTVSTTGRVVSLLELGAGFHPDFTGRENAILNASIHGVSRSEIDRRMEPIIEFAELRNFIDAPVRAYSSGMYARLGFAVASELEPDILLLDEILAVGDISFQNKCLSRIAEFQRRGVTIVFVSHAAASVERVCNRAIWLSGGSIHADGRPADVLRAYHQNESVETTHSARIDDNANWYLARIVAIRCRGGDQMVTDRVISGSPVDIEVGYETATTAPIVISLVVRTVDGVVVGGVDSRADLASRSYDHGLHTATFSMPQFPLLDGRFSIDVSLSTAAGEILQTIERAIELTVFPDGRGVGPVAFRGDWGVEATPAEHTGATLEAPSAP